MSLLIKALDKAQAEKAQASKDKSTKKTSAKTKATKPAKKKPEKLTEELSLEQPAEHVDMQPKEEVSDDVPQALKGSAADESQQEGTQVLPARKAALENSAEPPRRAPAQAQAANVFTAKHTETHNRTATIAIILGLLALAVLGVIAYWYQMTFNAPTPVIPPRPMMQQAQQETPAPLPEMAVKSAPEGAVDIEVIAPEMIDEAEADITQAEQPADAKVTVTEVIQSSEPTVRVAVVESATPSVFKTASQSSNAIEKPAIEETLTDNEAVVTTNIEEAGEQAELTLEKPSIKVTPKEVETSVNPVLMRAYEAYNAGNDIQAQQDYKEVLKRNGPNVDAMLGLGAIASRQGRLADANDWYRKVLEIEPRNEVAKAGLLSLQQSQANPPQASESRVKSMIATAPDDANLQAALGDIYANQNQWSAAQRAYFDAYRLSQSAENAFNLAVSLDQIGKPVLALPYYREALQKAAPSSAIDVNALEARILSIE